MSRTKDISLHVVPRKKRGRLRWTVLIAVQILILLHVGLWLLSKHFGWFGGATITPIEPSEGMEFVKHGVVNAGAIFFALALIATLVFGRWFCGWGCHIVFLQDWCYALLRKIGIRPKPFRARLLGYVPLGLGLYMFVWPLFYRIALAPWLQPNLSWPSITTHLTTTDYWDSFASPIVALPFLLICGFATVYTLGAKGFCTYGCPYGGFFAPLDRISPMRVRVNDSCEQCGKCTAACTSNVRVHEEVHLHSMVVDSGCMKTMDCIDACPNNALSVGFCGTSTGKRTKRSGKKYDLKLSGEFLVATTFLVGFFSFRGLYASVPMLMAVGMSLVCVWILWKGVQILRTEHVHLHQYQLAYHGSVTRAGKLMLVVSLFVALFILQSACVQLFTVVGNNAGKHGDLDKAYTYYKLSGPMTDGGIGFSSNPNVDLAMSKILEAKNEYKEAEFVLRRLNAFVGEEETARMVLGQNLQLHRNDETVESFYMNELGKNPNWTFVWEDYIAWLRRKGRHEQAVGASSRANTLNPNAPRLQIQWQLLHQQVQ